MKNCTVLALFSFSSFLSMFGQEDTLSHDKQSVTIESLVELFTELDDVTFQTYQITKEGEEYFFKHKTNHSRKNLPEDFVSIAFTQNYQMLRISVKMYKDLRQKLIQEIEQNKDFFFCEEMKDKEGKPIFVYKSKERDTRYHQYVYVFFFEQDQFLDMVYDSK